MNFSKLKQLWKKLKYWQKGAVVGSVGLSIIAWGSMGLALLCAESATTESGRWSCINIIYPWLLYVPIDDYLSSKIENYVSTIVYPNIYSLLDFIVIFLIGMVLGSITGFIFGKIKSPSNAHN